MRKARSPTASTSVVQAKGIYASTAAVDVGVRTTHASTLAAQRYHLAFLADAQLLRLAHESRLRNIRSQSHAIAGFCGIHPIARMPHSRWSPND